MPVRESSEWNGGRENHRRLYRAFQDIDADEDYVYLIYSGNKYKGDSLPINECRHLVVYSWDGNPVRHFILDRNILKQVTGENQRLMQFSILSRK